MAKWKPWLKMWVEWIDDPKMLSLSLAQQGAWWRLLALAQKCMADGLLVKGNGAPLSLNEIADTLRFITKPDRKVFDSMIKTMTDQGSLHWNANALVVTHFAERQAKTSSETPEAIRDRVRRHREKQVTENPLQEKEPVSASPLPSQEGEGEAEGVTQKNSLHVTQNSLQPSLALAEISKLHEEYFGIISPVLSEKFKDFVENYRGPVEWIKEAFAEAVKYKNRRWQYVEKILYTWQEKGGPHADRRGDDTHQRGNSKSAGFGGFKAIESGPDDRDED